MCVSLNVRSDVIPCVPLRTLSQVKKIYGRFRAYDVAEKGILNKL